MKRIFTEPARHVQCYNLSGLQTPCDKTERRYGREVAAGMLIGILQDEKANK
jgi:hypothetical protein